MAGKNPGLQEALELLTVSSVEGKSYYITKDWKEVPEYLAIAGEIKLGCGKWAWGEFVTFMNDLQLASSDGRGIINKGTARFPRFTLWIRPSEEGKLSSLHMQITHGPSLHRLNSWRLEMSLLRAAKPQRDSSTCAARDIEYGSEFWRYFRETYDLLNRGFSERDILEWYGK